MEEDAVYMAQGAGCRLQAAVFKLKDAGCRGRMQDAGCRVQSARYKVQVAGWG